MPNVPRTPLPKLPTLAENAKFDALATRIKKLEDSNKRLEEEIAILKKRLSAR